MYKVVRLVSFVIRAYLCYCTIDNIPILADPIANNILLEVISIYTILMIISRLTVSTFYKKGEAPVFGAIAYFVVYILYLGITYAIMLHMTNMGILPIQI